LNPSWTINNPDSKPGKVFTREEIFSSIWGNNVIAVNWYQIHHKDKEKDTEFYKNIAPRLSFQNADISSLLLRVLHFGVDFKPPYQRDLCWSIDDKKKLTDSIMHHLDIGKFVFKRLPFKVNAPDSEIVDGKQRLNAILEFYGDQFRYKGFLYSELSFKDKHTFNDCPIVSAMLSEGTDLKTILNIFLSINVTGRQPTEEDLSKARQMLSEINNS